MKTKIKCPNCNEIVWDLAAGSKLNKCWNCMTAFDTYDEEVKNEKQG